MKFFILFPLIFGASEAVASICGRVADPRRVHSLLTWRDAPETSPEVSHRHDLRLSLLTTTRVSDNATYPVVVRYFSSCGGGAEVETSTCLGSHLGAEEEVEFRAQVVVVECPASGEVEQVVSIGGRGREVASIRLQFLCQCLCEKDGDPGCPTTDGKGYRGRRNVEDERERRREERRRERKKNRSESERSARRRERKERRKERRRNEMRGTEAREDDITTVSPDGRNVTGPEWERCMYADDTQCMATPSSAVCSGRGTCVCGECECHQRVDPSEMVFGQFCECTNFLCGRFNGQLCGGPDRGECECDTCRCNPGWTGTACECEDAQDECVEPESGEVCSGNGECECNECKCYETEEGRYSGKWCEDCPTCRSRCSDYRACVECQVFWQGELTEEECESQCTEFNATVVQSVAPEDPSERLCTFFDQNDCRFTFVYGTDVFGQRTVRVQRTLECPPPRTVAVAPTGPLTPDFFARCFDAESQCKATPSSAVCSGRGTCVCGMCECYPREDPSEMVFGQFCECTNFLCDRFDGQLCGGPDRGVCECDICRCNPGWMGAACECQDSQDECMNPESGEVCSGNGECECNECKCYEKEEGRYSGRWCEDCPTCRGRCSDYRACVECQVFWQGELTEEECESQCTEFNATVVQSLSPEDPSERLCTFFDQNDCRFTFVYGTDAFGQRTVRVQSTLECPPPRRDGVRTIGPLTPDFFARCVDADESQCKATASSAVCSGRGTCVCGMCECYPRDDPSEMVFGEFCECSNFLCDRFNGQVCGGPDRGECECNSCRCNPGWTGTACECEDAQDACVDPESGEVCSGNGMCECNHCKCYEMEEGRYSGKWCEDCPTCRGRCSDYRACVECQVFGQGELTEEECESQCTEFNATVVQSVAPEDPSERLCTFFDQNDCRFTFLYGTDAFGQRAVRVESTLECPPPRIDAPTGRKRDRKNRKRMRKERKRGRENQDQERESERAARRRERKERRKERKRNKMRGIETSRDVTTAPDGRNVTGPEWERCMYADDTQCKETPLSAVCSGIGTCVCGMCECYPREDPSEMVFGEFCECTNFLCDRFNGQVCGGPDRGECECNSCRCNPGWTGAACVCQDSQDECMNPESGEMCSGNGMCECNKCKCYETEEGRYYGKWCEDCPTCRGKCSDYRACVECQVFRQGELTEEECETECTQFNATVVQLVSPEDPSERLCTFFDENDCRFKFVYGYDDDREVVVRVQSTLECPPLMRSWW